MLFPFIIAGADLWAWRESALVEAQANGLEKTEVDWLLQYCCQVERLALHLGTIQTQPAIAARWPLTELSWRWQQRIQVRVPLQHLASVTDWRIFRLRVSPAVLIPRPETELIIDYVVGAIAEHPCGTALERGTWVDLGTGSGAIAIGLAAALPKATIIAVDISAAALEIAQQNAVDNGLSNRIQFLHGSWFEPLIPYLGKLAGVVSNPPYIPHNLIPTLQLEVAHHEPHLALDGGPDGLAYIRHLIDTAPAYLMPGGLWIVEHMAGQADSILSLLSTHGQYTHLQQLPDLNQPERFILARYQETETDISRMTDTPNHTP